MVDDVASTGVLSIRPYVVDDVASTGGERERRFRVYKEAPGLRPGPRGEHRYTISFVPTGEEDDEGPAPAPAEGSPRCDCSAASVELGSEVLTRGRAAVQEGH